MSQLREANEKNTYKNYRENLKKYPQPTDNLNKP